MLLGRPLGDTIDRVRAYLASAMVARPFEENPLITPIVDACGVVLIDACDGQFRARPPRE